MFNRKLLFKSFPKFPSVERDLALVMDKSVTNGETLKLIKKFSDKSLKSVELFDIYQGEQIGKNKKSMAFNLVFVSYDRTLNVEEIDSAMKNILDALVEKLNAELR